MDNGGEFKKEFSELCDNMGMQKFVGLPWNPQSNSILERIHQVLADGMRVFDLENMDIDPEDEDPFDEYLTSVAYAIRSAFHQTHGKSPAQLVYGRDMFLPIDTEIDWEEIKIRKQNRIRVSNDRENRSRIPHTYQPGDLVTVKKPGILRKMSIPREGPYKVIRHNDNGSITIEKAPFDYMKVNIRRVHPYYSINNGEPTENDA